MSSPATSANTSGYCMQCGDPLLAGSRFCSKCGAVTTAKSPSPPHNLNDSAVATTSTSIAGPAFERQMKVAWSCLKEVQAKIDQIKEAKERGDREVNEGTLRGTLAATALQGTLEREFEEGLTIA